MCMSAHALALYHKVSCAHSKRPPPLRFPTVTYTYYFYVAVAQLYLVTRIIFC